MAEACSDCLAEQFEFLEESEYPFPLSVVSDPPERIYCVDGVPVTTPHKGMVGPLVTTLTVPAETLAASGAWTANQVPIDWVNTTARTVRGLIMFDGNIQFVGSEAIDWTFTLHMNVSVSSGDAGGPATTVAQSNYAGSRTVPMSCIYGPVEVDSGATLHADMTITYSSTGGGPGTASFQGAAFAGLFIGGAE